MPRTGDWARDAYLLAVSKEKPFLDPAGGGPEKITERGLTHLGHGTLQTIQNTVPYPKPYVTMDDENTYSRGRTKF